MNLELIRYQPEFSQDCQVLERACAQGETFRMWFHREFFHARSESYSYWEIWLIRDQGRIVASSAWAEKSIQVRGVEKKAAYLYDFRVHPAYRRLGLGKRLMGRTMESLRERGIRIRYAYAIHDNRETMGFHGQVGSAASPGFRYWVWPVFRKLGHTGPEIESHSNPIGVHQMTLSRSGSPDFYCNPMGDGILKGYQKSYQSSGASASVWSNRGIVEEVIEKIPTRLSVLRSLLGSWPLNRMQWPQMPAPGEKLRSEIVFDFSSADANSTRALAIELNNDAYSRGIQYLYYLVPEAHVPRFHAISDLAPKWASPWIPYSLIYHDMDLAIQPRFSDPYTDVRDI